VRDRRRARALALALAIAWMVIVSPAASLAADPAASPDAPMVGTGDTRSEGEGPGLVGSPLLIAAGVVLLGVLTAAGTLVVLRISGTRRD
jgi:hypothetical protein